MKVKLQQINDRDESVPPLRQRLPHCIRRKGNSWGFASTLGTVHFVLVTVYLLGMLYVFSSEN